MTRKERKAERNSNLIAFMLTVLLIELLTVGNWFVVQIWFGSFGGDFSFRGAVIITSIILGLEAMLIGLPIFYGFKNKKR